MSVENAADRETYQAFRVPVTVRTKPNYGKRHEIFIVQANTKDDAIEEVDAKPDVAHIYDEKVTETRVYDDGFPVPDTNQQTEEVSA